MYANINQIMAQHYHLFLATDLTETKPISKINTTNRRLDKSTHLLQNSTTLRQTYVIVERLQWRAMARGYRQANLVRISA